MRTHSTPRHGHPASVRLAVVIAAIVGLVAACSASVGVAGPIPTPPATPVGSVLPGDGTSTEPTAPASASPATAAASASPGTSPAASIGPTAAPIASPVATTTVRVYFFQPDPAGGDAHLVPVLRTVPATRAVATAAVRELLAGPRSDERGFLTMIPAGSQLLGITIDGSVATVDLTGAFESGGGSASMFGRLAQLVFTATQFPTVDAVRLRLDGQPVDSIGGEGVIVGAGLGRTESTSSLPPIFVDRPAWGGAFPSPGRVTGLANVFEAQFLVQVLDSQHRVLVEAPVHATCGTGCWGTFDVTVRYSVPTAQWGTLRVFDPSAKDGTPIDVREYPIWLTPAG
jgi:germination protein M